MNLNSAENLTCMMGKILRETHTHTPDHNILNQYVIWMKEHGFSHSYISNVCLAIERFTEFNNNPIKFGGGKKPKLNPKDTLSEAEIAIILNSCSNFREKALVSILAYSGIRNDELCNLKVEDYLKETQQLKIVNGKGRKGRIVNISGKCCLDIDNYLNNYSRQITDYLFTTLRNNYQICDKTVRRIIIQK